MHHRARCLRRERHGLHGLHKKRWRRCDRGRVGLESLRLSSPFASELAQADVHCAMDYETRVLQGLDAEDGELVSDIDCFAAGFAMAMAVDGDSIASRVPTAWRRASASTTASMPLSVRDTLRGASTNMGSRATTECWVGRPSAALGSSVAWRDVGNSGLSGLPCLVNPKKMLAARGAVALTVARSGARSHLGSRPSAALSARGLLARLLA